jgi:hypothetical protein
MLQKAGYLWLGNPTLEWAYGYLYNPGSRDSGRVKGFFDQAGLRPML